QAFLAEPERLVSTRCCPFCCPRSRPARLLRQQNIMICRAKNGTGTDGTRTRDLRRDRPAFTSNTTRPTGWDDGGEVPTMLHMRLLEQLGAASVLQASRFRCD